MENVCVDTTQQETTVRNVHHYTMISLGSQEMEKQGLQMNAEVSGREFTDPGFQDEHSPCQQAKFPNKDFCRFTLMVPLQKLVMTGNDNCWSLMENFSMHLFYCSWPVWAIGKWNLQGRNMFFMQLHPPCVLTLQGFVKGLRYHRIGLSYCNSSQPDKLLRPCWDSHAVLQFLFIMKIKHCRQMKCVLFRYFLHDSQ